MCVSSLFCFLSPPSRISKGGFCPGGFDRVKSCNSLQIFRLLGNDARRKAVVFVAGIWLGSVYEIIFHPNVTAANGQAGVYRFEFEPNDSYTFEAVQMGHELLAKNMLVLRNNFAYYPMPNAALPRYQQEKALYDVSRIPILFEDDLFADISYLPLNITSGYRLLRLMELNERPSSRDIVIYKALPNEMPSVGGIITTVPQTPLKGALEDEEIIALIGNYVPAASKPVLLYPGGA